MSNYLVLILNDRGELQTRFSSSGEEQELRKLFEKSQEADRWAHRRLVECGSDCYALVQHTRMMKRDGTPMAIKITRDQALGGMFPKAKGPAVKSTLSKNAPLTFRMTCHQTRVEFSRG